MTVTTALVSGGEGWLGTHFTLGKVVPAESALTDGSAQARATARPARDCPASKPRYATDLLSNVRGVCTRQLRAPAAVVVIVAKRRAFPTDASVSSTEPLLNCSMRTDAAFAETSSSITQD